MSASTQMVFDDPSKFGLLATQVKIDMTKAAQNTVNIMAGRARKEAIKIVKRKFINRNTFTTRQIQFTPMAESKYIKIEAIQATVGATDKAPWMARQEEGGKHTPSRGKTLAIPTDYARGGSIRRPVAPTMRLSRITKRRRVSHTPGKKAYSARAKSRKAITVAGAYMAFKTGKFYTYKGDAYIHENLFMVERFVKRGRHGVAFKLRTVYDFEMKATTTNPEPWLMPACQSVADQVQIIFNQQMEKISPQQMKFQF